MGKESGFWVLNADALLGSDGRIGNGGFCGRNVREVLDSGVGPLGTHRLV